MSTINFAEPIQKTESIPPTKVNFQQPKQKKRAPLLSILSFLIIVALSIGAIVAIRTYLISPYVIPSGSMENTIQIDDHVLAEQFFKYTNDPIRPGDIVTFTNPKDPNITLIKRVIATEGQTVNFKDGQVYVDGKIIDEPYVHGAETIPAEYTEENTVINYPYTIPDGHIWVMGDNRANSADSRVFGSVPTDSVTGRAICIYWPFEHIASLK